MFNKKSIATVALSLSMLSVASLANATTITYNDRTTFEAAISNIIIDDFNSPSYSFFNTAVDMKNLSAGNIGYESTGWDAPNWNLNTSQSLCWGCNGSGQILLNDTTIGTADGVYGLGLDILSNSSNLPYDAFVTFGDGSTQNIDLGSGARFFGLTSDFLIKQVHFGLTDGGITQGGSFLVDNVTIGNDVPEPAPLALLGLGLLGLGLMRKNRE